MYLLYTRALDTLPWYLRVVHGLWEDNELGVLRVLRLIKVLRLLKVKGNPRHLGT